MDGKTLGDMPVNYSPDIADHDRNFYRNGNDGITLRQHFAGLAMQGALSDGQEIIDKERFATFCVGIADALLAALSQPATQQGDGTVSDKPETFQQMIDRTAFGVMTGFVRGESLQTITSVVAQQAILWNRDMREREAAETKAKRAKARKK